MEKLAVFALRRCIDQCQSLHITLFNSGSNNRRSLKERIGYDRRDAAIGSPVIYSAVSWSVANLIRTYVSATYKESFAKSQEA
jgi:hypothetical protein